MREGLHARTISAPEGVGALFVGVAMIRPSGVSPDTDGDGRIQGGVKAEGWAPKGMFQMSRLVSCQLRIMEKTLAHYRLSLKGM